jgi:hypothetical protein
MCLGFIGSKLHGEQRRKKSENYGLAVPSHILLITHSRNDMREYIS